MSHVRLDLPKVTSNNILPLVRQNVKNRKANYANPDLVAQLHNQFKTLKHEIEQLRQRRNEHAAIAKQIVTMDDDEKREELMNQHAKVGKSYKK